MKTFYLVAAILGYLAANVLVFQETFENGNILLWTDPAATVAGMFATRISTIFVIDLFVAVAVALPWMIAEGRRVGMRRAWLFLILVPLFGLAGSFPLFLYLRERAIEAQR